MLINVGFAFTLLLSTFYQSEDENTSKFSTITSLLSSDKLKRSDTDFIKIVQLLEQDKDIKNKTIMAVHLVYSFHTNSEFIFTSFDEGTQNDTVKDFITRKNWSEYDRWYSAINSFEVEYQSERIPDYLIYSFSDTVIDPTTTWYVDAQIFYIHSLLANPEDPNIPEFFE
ncbi:uncharacterized protein METZ01_LOCUS417579, partial [marine metagenome]